jgi:hypothetical protein
VRSARPAVAPSGPPRSYRRGPAAIYSALVTRAGRSSRGLAALFGSDPYAAVARVVRDAGAAVTAAEIKRVLRAAGVAALDKRAWDRLQRRLRDDEHVIVEPGHRYRWAAAPAVPSPADALAALVRAGGGRVRPAHVEVVRRAITDAPDRSESTARERQAVLDGVRALAELASEVEELTVNQASARAMIHRVRSRVRLSGLEPIESAGASARFDRRRHEPIGRPIAEGATVLVVRPGYAWRTPAEEVLVARAVVQE